MTGHRREAAGSLLAAPTPSGGGEITDFLYGRSAFFAGTANVILQLGWPAVGHGVVHGAVASGSVMKRPRKRLRTTLTHLVVAMMATDEERDAWRDAVNGQHRQVRSGPGAPVKYNAFDRELQLWVAACIYYGTVDVYERFHGPMEDVAADWLYQESARFGTTLQMSPDQWPPNREAFDVYWREGLAKIEFDETVKAYLVGLLELTQVSPRIRRRYGDFHRWINTGFLPDEVKDKLGLSWSAEDERKHAAMCRRSGRRADRLPAPVRLFPLNFYLLDFRLRRMARRPLV